MNFLVLTKTGGIFGYIVSVMGWIMSAIFSFTEFFGVMNIGLSVILFTLVTRLILFPMTLNQQKTSKLMTVMQPEIDAIQKKYKGKTDNESAMKMSVETRAVYEKYGTSMTGGCLPLLIQLPVMLALYQVIYKIPAYVSSVRHYFDLVIAKLPVNFASTAEFISLAEAHNLANSDFSDMDKVVDLLYTLTDKEWAELSGVFPDIMNAVSSAGENVVEAINSMQRFLGMNITYTPLNVLSEFVTGLFHGGSDITIFVAIAALFIPLFSGWSQWFCTRLMTNGQPQQSSGSDEGMGSSMMKSMNIAMPIMSIVFCFMFPLGIGLYWVASSTFQLIQQVGTNAYFNRIDMDELIKKNVEKANKKKAKKGEAPTKINQTASQTLKNLQAQQAKEEQDQAAKKEKTDKQVKESTAYYNTSAKPGSLTAKANMVAMYNEKHEKKKK